MMMREAKCTIFQPRESLKDGHSSNLALRISRRGPHLFLSISLITRTNVYFFGNRFILFNLISFNAIIILNRLFNPCLTLQRVYILSQEKIILSFIFQVKDQMKSGFLLINISLFLMPNKR